MNESALIQLLYAYPAMQSKIAASWGQQECGIYLKYLLNLNHKFLDCSTTIVLGNLAALHDALHHYDKI